MKADLTFLDNNPGAAKFGNFINYYKFHSAKHRTDNLDPQMFPIQTNNSPLICLDIGCNTGELTKELYQYLKTLYPNRNVKILALDIDPTLIQRAQELCKESDISFITSNIMIDMDHKVINDFLKSYNKEMFDITFCFSVIMWIHLNNGDNGLLKFLTYMKSISETIIMELQPWNCYRNAQRRMKKSGSNFPLYETLKIRSNVEVMIESTITGETHKKIWESPHSTWKRKIQSFQLIA